MYLMRFVVQFFCVGTTAQCVIIPGGIAAFGAILTALYASSPITIGTVCAIIYIIPVVMDNTVRRAFACCDSRSRNHRTSRAHSGCEYGDHRFADVHFFIVKTPFCVGSFDGTSRKRTLRWKGVAVRTVSVRAYDSTRESIELFT